MSVFYQLKQQLSQKLAELRQPMDWASPIQMVQASLPLTDKNSDLLAWLKAQTTTFPQFFWQARDSELTFIALGECCHFDDLDQAQQFSHQYHFPLFGGLKFEGAAYFFLPQLLLTKKADELTACLYLQSSQLANCEQILTHFEQFAPLEVKAHSLLTRQQVADYERWQTNIHLAIEQIEQGQLSKVVLANATQLTFDQPLNGYDLLAQSRTQNLACYHFLLAENAQHCFIGSSPERLYQRNGALLYTEALAGTVAVVDDLVQTEQNAQWLLNDSKNLYENQLVVKDIYSHLADVIDDFDVGEREIKRLPLVQHLRRQIRATLQNGITDSDCLLRIQPTAAVAGLPRPQALQFIQQYEGFERGWYAGTLGFFSPQQAEFCVTLRSAQLHLEQITLYAGAGIVQGSDPLSEWQEIERKSQAMANLL